MIHNKFRPRAITKFYSMKLRMKTGRTEKYNWQTRVKWIPAGYGVNQTIISQQFKRLHYLACHAPKPVAQQWKHIYKNFMSKHFGINGRASVPYLNKWSCHAWM